MECFIAKVFVAVFAFLSGYCLGLKKIDRVMTRKEEIEEAAWCNYPLIKGREEEFIQGAEWADKTFLNKQSGILTISWWWQKLSTRQ